MGRRRRFLRFRHDSYLRMAVVLVLGLGIFRHKEYPGMKILDLAGQKVGLCVSDGLDSRTLALRLQAVVVSVVADSVCGWPFSVADYFCFKCYG